MHPSLLAELADTDLTTLEDVRQELQDLRHTLSQAQEMTADDIECMEGDVTFDGLTMEELEQAIKDVHTIYRKRLDAATGR